MQALVFKVTNDGFRRLSSEKVDLGDINTSLSSMYDAIGCDMIEHATIDSYESRNTYDIWVNENGGFENPLNFKFTSNGMTLPVYGDIIVTNSHVDNNGDSIDDGLDDPFIVHDIIETVMMAFEALNE